MKKMNDVPASVLDATNKKEQFFDKLDKSQWLRITQIILGVVLLQVICMFTPRWGESTIEMIHSFLWVFVASLALLPIYWVAAQEKFVSNKTFTVVWGAILIQLVGILLVRQMTGRQTEMVSFAGLMMPYILAPLVVTVLMGAACGAFTAVAVSVLGLGFVDPAFRMNYLAISLSAGMTAVFLMRDMRSRGQLLRAGFLVGLVVFLLSSLLGVIDYDVSRSTDMNLFVWGIVGAIGVSLALAILLGGTLPALEGIFKVITPVSWLELSDMNHKLLKQMQLTAPGTFHHCIVVAQLAEAAAEEVGANATHCRVVSYYHDIGKLKYPSYFAENINEGETSPHEGLSPSMSARIIIGHVSEGVEMAIAHQLNKPIIEAIQQHHGTSLAYYFYRKAMDNRKDMLDQAEFGIANVDDVPEVIESNFRYSGPIPQSRETGIVSLADIVEGATRSLKDPSPEQIDTMIDNVIRARVVEGHLDASGLTFGDLKKIRNSFASTVKNMRHSRIAYPKADDHVVDKGKEALAAEQEQPSSIIQEQNALEESPNDANSSLVEELNKKG
ncbi:MAG: HDIG domain-containing protein [Akkermansia sp.]